MLYLMEVTKENEGGRTLLSKFISEYVKTFVTARRDRQAFKWTCVNGFEFKRMNLE